MKNTTSFTQKRLVVDGKAKCSKCEEDKPLEAFSKSASSPIGIKSHCKECVAKKLAEISTPEFKEKARAYAQTNKDKRKAYNEANRERIYLQRKAFRDSKPPEWKQAEIERIMKYNREVVAHNHANRLISNATTRIGRALNQPISRAYARQFLGCNAQELKLHLESLFQVGMSWENYGRRKNTGISWEMDHRIPCRAFDLSKEEDREKCFHYLNVQPLWTVENARKDSKTV